VTSSRLLARNTALNLFGQVIPLGVAVVAVPVLIRALGEGRFGVLALAWALIGYFTLLDFGLGRALTQAASEAIGQGDSERLREMSVVSIASMFVLGVVGGVGLAAATPWLAYDVLKMEPGLRRKRRRRSISSRPRCPLRSHHRFSGPDRGAQHFGLATALRCPTRSSISSVHCSSSVLAQPCPDRRNSRRGPGADVRRPPDLQCQAIPGLRAWSVKRISTLMPILRVGGWIMISNVVSPIMVYLDRFVIGALLGMTAVTYYVTRSRSFQSCSSFPGRSSACSSRIRRHVLERSAANGADVRPGEPFRADRGLPLVLALSRSRESSASLVGRDFAANSTTVLQLLSSECSSTVLRRLRSRCFRRPAAPI